MKRINTKKKDRMKKQHAKARSTPIIAPPEKTDKKKSMFLVETICTFRHRYLVNAECADYAAEDVAMNDGRDVSQPEWQQKYLGETLIGTRPVTTADILALEQLDGETDGVPWMPHTKFLWNNE